MPNDALLKILLVDDDHIAQELVTLAFRRVGAAAAINSVSGAREAIAYLKGEGKFSDRESHPYPSLLITDLNMADGDGFMLLQMLRANPSHGIFPTVVMSSSEDQDDIKMSYLLGASRYFVKPHGFAALEHLAKLLYQMWQLTSLPAVDCNGRS